MSKRKRPCRVCRKWFRPSRRGGHQQKTCGDNGCRREWKKRKCREWRAQNQDHILEGRLARRIKSVTSGKRAHALTPNYPLKMAREVMGTQEAVFIELVLQLMLKGVRAIKVLEVVVNKGDPG